MSQLSTTERYARLKNWLGESGPRVFERIREAKACLADRGWVESEDGGGGNESLAIDRLEEECFGDLCGLMQLPHLFEVLEEFPKLAEWRERKYNLRKMWLELREKRKGATTTKRSGAGNVTEYRVRTEDDLRAENKMLKRELAILKRDHARIKRLLNRFMAEANEAIANQRVEYAET